MTKLRAINSNDKPLIAAALFLAGVSYRVRMFRNSARIVFVGDWQTVATALNNEGFRTLSGEITRYAFNDTNPAHGELFIHGVA